MNKKLKEKMQILVVEDNETMREGMIKILEKEGYKVYGASSGVEGISTLANRRCDLVITDFKMTGLDGLELLNKIKRDFQDTEVIVITAYGTIELAVEAMKSGAWDFMTKPFSKDELKLKVERVLEIINQRSVVRRLADENRYLRDEVEIRFNYGEIVGESRKMKSVYRAIEKVTKSDSSVLIYGESGTGKELVARAIHNNSLRKNGPFIRVNCGALAEGVLESELFGHERGAFTGALRRKKGRFELADHGTLFLDEIGDIPMGTQVKLLRVLQEREFERVGGEETIKVDVRVIAATHRNLKEDVNRERFREDLYYRLHILPIELPPLRERKEDIPLLANHFLKKIGTELNKPDLIISKEAIQRLIIYDWPGNVRELENAIERAVVLSEENTIGPEDFNFMFFENSGTKIAGNNLKLQESLNRFEKKLIENALIASGGIKSRAAKMLGIKESTLYYKMEKYGIS